MPEHPKKDGPSTKRMKQIVDEQLHKSGITDADATVMGSKIQKPSKTTRLVSWIVGGMGLFLVLLFSIVSAIAKTGGGEPLGIWFYVPAGGLLLAGLALGYPDRLKGIVDFVNRIRSKGNS